MINIVNWHVLFCYLFWEHLPFIYYITYCIVGCWLNLVSHNKKQVYLYVGVASLL